MRGIAESVWDTPYIEALQARRACSGASIRVTVGPRLRTKLP
jgi:hypothetical protein